MKNRNRKTLTEQKPQDRRHKKPRREKAIDARGTGVRPPRNSIGVGYAASKSIISTYLRHHHYSALYPQVFTLHTIITPTEDKAATRKKQKHDRLVWSLYKRETKKKYIYKTNISSDVLSYPPSEVNVGYI